MRAVVIREPGGPQVLELRTVPDPEPAPDEIVVAVRATAVNRADLLQRRGLYPAPAGAPPDVPGLEYAGVVESAGSRVKHWSIGDRVMGITGGGSYAERVRVHAAEALPIPSGLSFEEAAAIPEAFITADDALFGLMKLKPGEQVLIHAVASGVGTAAVQLACNAGAQVSGTSRSAGKLERVKALGLDQAIDASRQDFTVEASGVNGILDLVGGAYMSGNVKCAAPRGRIVLVGLSAGSQAELDLTLILRKRLTIMGTVMRSRPLAEKIAVAAAFAARTLPLFEQGVLRPVIDRVLPLSAAAAAHELLERNETVGKVVLALGA